MMQIDVDLRERLEMRREVLRQEQSVMLPHWRELRQFVNPFRGRFYGERPNQHAPDLSKQISSAALKARRILSSGMQAGLTSPSRQWFRLTTADPDRAKYHKVRGWCDEVHGRMMRILPGAGFYRSTHAVYDEMATFGNAANITQFNFNSVAKFTSLTCGEYYFGIGPDDKANVFYRDMFMTAAQMVEEFGADNCSDAVRRAASERPDTMFGVCHAIEPDIPSYTHFPFRSVYWETAGNSGKFLSVSGYDLFPVQCPRWTVVHGDTYGYGPGSEALCDVRGLMKMASSRLTAVNKKVEPPLQVHESLRGSGVKVLPNGITYVDDMSNKVVPLYPVDINLADLRDLISEAKADINSAMFVDLFMMLAANDNPQMTAREIIERHEEKMTNLGPVLEQLTGEFHTPAIEQLFEIMKDNDLLPDTPEEVEGQELKIEYVSILAQAQQMMGLKPLEQVLSFAGSAAGIFPEVRDNIDIDQAIRSYSDMVGAQTKILRDPDVVEKMRAERQQALEEKEQAAQIIQMAQSGQQAAAGAKLLSEVDTGPDTALAALLGGPGGA